jgi:hypothetical protein
VAIDRKMNTPQASAIEVTSGALAAAGSSFSRVRRKGSSIPSDGHGQAERQGDQESSRTSIRPQSFISTSPGRHRPDHQGRALRAGIAARRDQHREEEDQDDVGGDGILVKGEAGAGQELPKTSSTSQ